MSPRAYLSHPFLSALILATALTTLSIRPALATNQDWVFIIDVTGSTGALLPTWQEKLPDVIAVIRSYCPDARFGLVSHLDYPFDGHSSPGEYAYRMEAPLNSNTAGLTDALAALHSGSGLDEPESQFEAIEQSCSGAGRDLDGDLNFSDMGEVAPSDLGWAPANQKIIVHFTWPVSFHNYPAMEPTYPYPGSLPAAGLTSTIAALLGRGVAFYGLVDGPLGASRMKGIDPQTGRPLASYKTNTTNAMTELATATGGAVLPVGADASGLVDAIREIASGIAAAEDAPALNGWGLGLLCMLLLAGGAWFSISRRHKMGLA